MNTLLRAIITGFGFKLGSDLYRYIDNLADLSALVYHPQLNAYIPCNRDWIKQRAFQHLKRMAT